MTKIIIQTFKFENKLNQYHFLIFLFKQKTDKPPPPLRKSYVPFTTHFSCLSLFLFPSFPSSSPTFLEISNPKLNKTINSPINPSSHHYYYIQIIIKRKKHHSNSLIFFLNFSFFLSLALKNGHTKPNPTRRWALTHFAGNGKARRTPPSAFRCRRRGSAAECGVSAGMRRRIPMPRRLAFLGRGFPLRTLLATTVRSLRRSQGSAYKF